MRVRYPLIRGLVAVGLSILIASAFATIALGGPSAATAVHASARGSASEIFFTRTPLLRDGQLWGVRPDGSHLHRVRRGLPTGPSTVTAVLSQDRRRILCVCRKGEIDSIRLDGSHLRRIGRQPRSSLEEGVELGPSGQLLWERADGRIVTQRANGTGRHVLRNMEPSFERWIALSPGGSRVAFVEYRSRRETLAVASLDGTDRPRTIFRDRPGRYIAQQSWSSDGTTLAFAEALELEKGVEGNFQSDLYVIGSHGSRLHNVTQTPDEDERSPIFSPNGSQLAFVGFTDRGPALFTIGVKGGEPRYVHQINCQVDTCEFEPTVIGWAPARRR